MREYKKEIKDKMTSYFVEALNLRADEMGIPGIMNVETGATATPGVTSVNPTLYLWVGDRQVDHSWFDVYQVHLGIFFGCGTPQEGERLADIWEDILEDVLRSDESLGDSAITWNGSPEIASGNAPGMAFTTCSFNIEHDLQGKA